MRKKEKKKKSKEHYRHNPFRQGKPKYPISTHVLLGSQHCLRLQGVKVLMKEGKINDDLSNDVSRA